MNRKEIEIKKIMASPFQVGEIVEIKNKHVDEHTRSPEFTEKYEILDIKNDIAEVIRYRRTKMERSFEIQVDKLEKYIYQVGYNPFMKTDRVNSVNFSLSSIIHGLALKGEKRNYQINNIPVKECNWNPFVYTNGEKKYYQRGLVWPLEFKQNLIESIYSNVECGRIMVRLRSWKELEVMAMKGETELAFKDIVDGKQRMHTIKEFLNDEWPDKNGYYYSELSNAAQNQFEDHQLFQYVEIPENSDDSVVLRQFMKSNIQYFPQSEEHLQKVKQLYNTIK